MVRPGHFNNVERRLNYINYIYFTMIDKLEKTKQEYNKVFKSIGEFYGVGTMQSAQLIQVWLVCVLITNIYHTWCTVVSRICGPHKMFDIQNDWELELFEPQWLFVNIINKWNNIYDVRTHGNMLINIYVSHKGYNIIYGIAEQG